MKTLGGIGRIGKRQERSYSQTPGYVEREDPVARLRCSSDGQAELTVNGDTLTSFWACGVCGLPTGADDRTCRNHPEAVRFLRHVKVANG